ncbi:hypothetical protein EUX98_g1931 [Antrodiella citrinella]|uniref:Uncharacterized protein n=1 Tax=Antrodiella citrinella TaxID=2447956 RepID=A0A4S4N083_9APHY|nr:hypothetical protein EUX98_g1931 [Antrodiella citrinella]
MGLNPNFPADLDIRPLTHHDDFKSDVLPSDFDRKFDASAQEEAIRAYGIAGRVWEAAYAMKTFLNPPSGFMFDPAFGDRTCPGPLRILELGSGTGIVAAQLSEQLTGMDGLVIVTDLPEVCPLLEKNLQSHTARRGDPHPSVMVRPLAWGNRDHALSIHGELSGHSLTHIICSDLVSLRVEGICMRMLTCFPPVLTFVLC